MKVNLMLIIASPFIALGFVWGFVVNAFLSGVETYKAIHRIICED